MSVDVDQVRQTLSALLPKEVHFEVSLCHQARGDLYPREKVQAAKYAEKRLAEFTASRTLARRLLGQIGVEPTEILSGDHREPLWPEGVVGTISHSSEIVIVAVAKAGDVKSIGVDIEVRDQLKKELWDKILNPSELKILATLDAKESGPMSLLFFSTKESFYKAQFPITQEFIGFDALDLDLPMAESHLPFTILHAPTRQNLFDLTINLAGRSFPRFALSTCCIL